MTHPAMEHGPDLGQLARIPLFRGLSTEELERVAEVMRVCRYAPGARVIAEADAAEEVYCVAKGTLKIAVDQADGTQAIVAILGPGDTLGELSAVDHAPRSAHAIALGPVLLWALPRPTFERFVAVMPALQGNLTRVLAARLRTANRHILSLSTLDTRGRLLEHITNFAERYGQPDEGGLRIQLRLTQGDLASLVGASRERVNQILGDLKAGGVLSIDRALRIVVHDLPALRAGGTRGASLSAAG